ncbi:N-acetylmuramidase [Lactobacillus selangorensis]|uniref:N-acetylmuramidase n=1 Tax=Lactobacillus selangorensis TaxID=81857 RepID=A0A0R2FQI2_9LACO|nr:glycoside hydrolase family 73 protein [Lactobacillus selangorensis]KRN27276.1 N-acetylmuramidase [Lactobacillus selangorensis]KRN29941.1 N-acetylmuramidase [Lactobacillus selangorensis]
MAKKRGRKQQQQANLIVIFLGILLAATFVVIIGARFLGNAVDFDVNQQSRQESESVQAQRQQFIRNLAPYAQELQKTYHILPSITLAQAALESNWGQSSLASRYHNLFGVKSEDPANSQVLTTREYVNGEWQEVHARFRVYANDDASLLAHAQLLANGTDWNPQQYSDVLQATNYRTAAQALSDDGYATDPSYAEKLINVIETYHLSQYDQ